MISITREQLDRLIELQDNERQAARLQAELESIPGKMAELDAGLQDYERQVAAKQEELDALRKSYRSYENELDLNQSRIKKRQVQLHSVKTNKEYQALLKDIDEIRAANSRIEDASLQCLDDIDAAEKGLAEKKKTCAEQKQRIEAEKRRLEETAGQLRGRIDQLVGACRGIAASLDSGLVEQYHQVKKRCGGIGIVQVENAVCKGCHLNIPPQMYNELHRGNELRLCPHCHRLIYVSA